MSQNYPLIVSFGSLIIFYLVIYSIIRANRWINDKQRLIDEISIDLPEKIKTVRNSLEIFNRKIKEKYTPKPFSIQELSNFAGNFITDLIKSKIPAHPLKDKFLVFSILMKLWKYRHRLKATFSIQSL